MNRSRYLKLVLFVPETHAELVKKAIFSAGAGTQGNYRECCWQSSGVGQFRPDDAADPFLGKAGQLERVEEIRLETLVEQARLTEVIRALKESHPYEEPAFDLIERLSPD